MGNSTSKRSVHDDFEFWKYNQFTLRITSPTLDRIILVGVNEALWHEWDTRFDVLLLTSSEAKEYIEIVEQLKTPPNHILDFKKGKEVARFPTCAQGVDRWRQVVKLLSTESPWEGVRESMSERGTLFRNLFGQINRRAIEARTVRNSDLAREFEMRVWYRFQRNQKVDNFVKANCRELLS